MVTVYMMGAAVTFRVAVAAVSPGLLEKVSATEPAFFRYCFAGIAIVMVEPLTTFTSNASSGSAATVTAVVPETKPLPMTATTYRSVSPAVVWGGMDDGNMEVTAATGAVTVISTSIGVRAAAPAGVTVTVPVSLAPRVAV